MTIEADLKRKFIVNGRQYASIEEMPEAIRQAFQKGMSGGHGAIRVNTETRIVFNGKEYNGIEDMPNDAREAYEKIMKAAMGADASSLAPPGAGRSLTGPRTQLTLSGRSMPVEARVSVSLSSRTLIIALISLASALGLYFLFYK